MQIISLSNCKKAENGFSDIKVVITRDQESTMVVLYAQAQKGANANAKSSMPTFHEEILKMSSRQLFEEMTNLFVGLKITY
jgi:hypothetical protein